MFLYRFPAVNRLGEKCHKEDKIPSPYGSPWPADPTNSTEAFTLPHSLRVVKDDVDQAADAEAKVYSRANDGETEVVPDTAVQLPALLDLLHPEHQQPAHDDQHADPDDELDNEPQHVEGIPPCLSMEESEHRAVVRTTPEYKGFAAKQQYMQPWYITHDIVS